MNFLAKTIILSILLPVLQGTNLYAGNSNSIEKFLFLENKLIKSQEQNIYNIIQESTIRYLAPVAASFVVSRLLKYVLWDNLEPTGVITWIPCVGGAYKSISKQMNNLVFILLSPVAIFYVNKFYPGRSISYVHILEQFVKKWPVNKFNTPRKFCNLFDGLYKIYSENKRLNISEYFARSFIANIAQQTIDFIGNNRQEDESEIDFFLGEISKIQLTDEAKGQIEKEINQLKRTSPNSSDYSVLINHIQWILSLPWSKYTQDVIDLAKAKEILDSDHYGLESVKERILDFLAVMSLKKGCKVPIICLSGPPGVGKTSIGKSIAKCMGKKFFRVSLGGVNDESEIRGHRRTYVGAMPGRFIQAIRKTESSNPLILLDEIDKISSSGKGDPFSALLEVLDPGQNSSFYDNYLGVNFDLSKVMFVATANYLDRIPKPLQDRMEVIELTGYSAEEKLYITKCHLIPKAIKDSGLEGKGFQVSDQILAYIIKNYTKEPGIREMERYIYTLCSKFARHFKESGNKLEFCKTNIAKFLNEQCVKEHL